MIALWMLSAICLGAITALACHLLEKGLTAWHRPTRLVWVVGVAISAILPVAGIARGIGAPARPDRTSSPLAQTATSAGISKWSPVSAIVEGGGASVTTLSRPVDGLLGLVWMISSICCACALVVVTIRARRLVNLSPVRVLGRTEVRVTRNTGPALVGVLHYEIVMPRWVDELSPEQQALIVAHEQQHAIAFDPALIWAAAGAIVLFPWNASLWYMLRRLRTSIEMDCDDRVLQAAPDVHAYASLLIDVSALMASRPMLTPALNESSSQLQRRIVAMFSKHRSSGRRRALGLSVGGVILLVAAARAPQPHIEIMPPGESRSADASTPGSRATRLGQESSAPPATSPRKSAEAIARRLEPQAFDKVATPGSSAIGLLFDSSGSVVHHSRIPIRDDNENLRQFFPQLFPNAQEADRAPFVIMSRIEGFAGRRHVDLVAVFLVKPERRSGGRPYFEYQVENPAAQVEGTGVPIYPTDLRAARVQGEAWAQFVVKEDGRPDIRTFKVLKTTDQRFADAVRDAVPAMRFRAAQLDGRSVKQVVQQSFLFRIAR